MSERKSASFTVRGATPSEESLTLMISGCTVWPGEVVYLTMRRDGDGKSWRYSIALRPGDAARARDAIDEALLGPGTRGRAMLTRLRAAEQAFGEELVAIVTPLVRELCSDVEAIKAVYMSPDGRDLLVAGNAWTPTLSQLGTQLSSDVTRFVSDACGEPLVVDGRYTEHDVQPDGWVKVYSKEPPS